MQCLNRIIRKTDGRKASLGLALQRILECVPDSGDDPSEDGKGTNNNIANVKTGFGIIHQNAMKYRG